MGSSEDSAFGRLSIRVIEFAGPCAQGVLDPVIVACPMSCSGLIDSIVLFKDNAFLGTSAHESMLPVGSLLAPCRIIVVGRDLAKR